MIHSNFRKMLTGLACWAKAAKDYLTYQAKHGKPPPRPDESKAEIPEAHGIQVSRSPIPYLARLAKRKNTGGLRPVPLVFDNSDNPLYQLSCVAQEVLDFPESQWPAGVTASKGTNGLSALLRLIVTQGGRSASIAELGRVAAVVKSILDGTIEVKEPPGAPVSDPKVKAGRQRGPKGKLTIEMFLKFQETQDDWHKWSSRRLGNKWEVSHTAVLNHEGWKAMQLLAQRVRPTDTVDDDEIDDE